MAKILASASTSTVLGVPPENIVEIVVYMELVPEQLRYEDVRPTSVPVAASAHPWRDAKSTGQKILTPLKLPDR